MTVTKNPESSPIGFLFMLIITGIVAGTLDGVAAVINAYLSNDVGPVRVFQFIASGVFGRDAFAHSFMAIWGIVFHYLIATVWSGIFLLSYNRLKLHKIGVTLNALLYGCIIWVVMNMIVLPLSNVPQGTPDAKRMIIGALILIIAVGFPISYMTSRYFKNMVSTN
jgi:hypothetical protein